MLTSNKIDLRRHPERIPAALARQNRWDFYYEVRGGQGIVYVVYDHKQGFPFVLKTYQDEVFQRDLKTSFRFEREAYAWIRLGAHQNVTHAHFVERYDKPYLVLEYVTGGDLRQWLRMQWLRGRGPQLREALRLALQCCDGMQYAAAHGVTPHHDLKPENCLLTEDGTLKVTDFGMARVVAAGAEPQASDDAAGSGSGVGPDSAAQLTRTGGTPHYMAPEQWESGRTDERADIYSFGVMLYELLVGQHPFAARMQASGMQPGGQGYRTRLMRLHVSERPPLEVIGHEALRHVVERCLEKKAARRWAGFAEVRVTLAGVYEGEFGEPAPAAVKERELHVSELGNRGFSLWVLGRHKEALAPLNKAIELKPDIFQLWLNRGLVLTELKRYDEALTSLNKAVELKPDAAEAWNNRGRVFADLQRHAEALMNYDRAIELNPGNPQAWNNRGVVLNALKRYNEALASYDQAVEIMPEYANAWYNRGGVLAALKRPDEALASYNQAMRLKPDDPLLCNKCGFELRNLGWYEEALASYDRALDHQPDYAEVWFRRGVVLNDLKRPEESLASYDRAVALWPDHVDAWYNRGIVLGVLKRYEEALASCDRMVALKADDAGGWKNRGVMLLMLQRTQESYESFGRAVALDPQLAEAWFFMGALLCNAGQYEQGATYLERAQRLGDPRAAAALRNCRQH